MNRKLPIVCALADAILTIIIVFAIAGFDGKTPIELVTRFKGFFLIVLIISLIAAWRGYIDAARILIGYQGWVKPAREGFFIGFVPLPMSHVFGILQEAFAAGPPWPSLGHSPMSEWLKYFVWIFGSSVFCGAIGALYGLLLSKINRVILDKYK